MCAVLGGVYIDAGFVEEGMTADLNSAFVDDGPIDATSYQSITIIYW